MNKPRYVLSDYTALLSGDDAPLIVGGQAVNLWSMLASSMDNHSALQLQEYQPFVSKDCDVVGDRKLLQKLRRKSQMAVYETRFGQGTFCVGYLYFPDDPEKNPFIEVLSGIKGLRRDEMGDGVLVELNEISYRTLNPIQLMQAKLANVVKYPRKTGKTSGM